ncbi:MAG TPA: universal stress protein [Terriglobales bacterium]|nr:universal stress protein [Terriglobales bacterium]
MQLKSILCPIDFSDFSVGAYRHALSIAEHYKATVVAQHVVELWKYPFADYAAYEADYAKISRALSEGGEVRLREFIQEHSHKGIRPELVVNLGNAADSILSVAQARNVELIVMGTHGRRGFDCLVLGSTTHRVMGRASCPVLVISGQPREAGATVPEGRQVHRLSRVLYRTDFSENSERALDYAISATAEHDGDVTLLHVVEHLPRSAKARELMATCSQRLDKLIPAETRKALKVWTVVKVGKPYEQIVQQALTEQSDMITMAARGADALDRAVFGSTTYRVIQLGPCPVLAIHT